MKKLIYFLIASILLVSCEPANLEEKVTEVTTGKVTVTIGQARTIMPAVPESDHFTITLDAGARDGGRSITVGRGESSATFDNVSMGSYTVMVNAYDEGNNVIATGSSSVDVKPASDNKVTVTLDYIRTGTGSFSVDITWDVRKEGTPFTDALERGSVGFRAWDVKNGRAYHDAPVQWASAEDIEKKSFTYSQSGVPVTDGDDIAFRIYTGTDDGEQCIAETFYTTVQVLGNINSRPDGNENSNFAITDETVSFYIKNVNPSTVEVSYGDDSSSQINVKWDYPRLGNGNYNGRLSVWLVNDKGTQVGDTKVFSYDQTILSAETVFSGLSTGSTYSVYFYNESDTGVSAVTVGASGIRPVVTVEGIHFISSFPETVSAGDHFDVIAEVTPVYAGNTAYTLTVSEGAEVSGNRTVRFPSYGVYTVTAVSASNSSHTASGTVTVKLASPHALADFTDEGISVSWDSVADADKYIVTKDGSASVTVDGTSWLDRDVVSGVKYTYSVVAVKDGDSRFDSLSSTAVSSLIPCPEVTVIMPEALTNVSLLDALQSALGESAHVTDKDSLRIRLCEPVEGASSYQWALNGRTVASGSYGDVSDVVITHETVGLDISSSESSNALRLSVTVNGSVYSATVYFRYIESDPGKVHISGESTVTYGTPVQLSVTFDNETGTAPVLVWSSSDETIAKVDENGVVTSLRDGEFTVTATIEATGESASFGMFSFIPVSEISVSELPVSYMIIKKNGVSISDTRYQSVNLMDYVSVHAANGKLWSEGNNLTWYSSDSDVLYVSPEGVIDTANSKKGGRAVISYRASNGVEGSFEIEVRNLDVLGDGEVVTGSEVVWVGHWLVGNYHEHSLALAVNGSAVSSYDGHKLTWCLKSERDKQTHQSGVYRMELKNYNSTSPTLVIGQHGTRNVTVDLFIDDASGNEICKVSFTRQPT